MVEDSVNPQYNEEFSYCLSQAELGGKVVKLVLQDHERSGPGLGLGQARNVIGLAVLPLDRQQSTVNISLG